MRGSRFLGVDLGIGLDPLSGVAVGDFVVVVFGEGRHDIDAQDAVVGVVLSVHMNAEVDVDRPALLAHCFLAVLLPEGIVEGVDHR